MEQETLILTHEQIIERIKRIAWQIYEDNCDESSVILIGIPNRGLVVTQLIENELKQIADLKIVRGIVDPGPDGFEVSGEIQGRSVVLIDDVLNSGRTLMEAAAAVMSHKPAQLRTAILANRDHKLFPIGADYVGKSLATTLQEHISFKSEDLKALSVTLQ